MSNYDVDDILKEVRKRREENEALVKGAEADISERKEEQNIEEEGGEAPSAEAIIEETAQDMLVGDEKADEGEQTVHELQKDEPSEGERVIRSDEYEDISSKDEKGLANDEPFIVRKKDGGAINPAELYSEESESRQKNRKEKKKKAKKGKIIRAILIGILILVIGCGVGAYIYVDTALNRATDNTEQSESLNEWTGMDVLKEDFTPINENPKSEISSYKDMLKTWYYNGKPVSSTHVLNVLLVGEDTRDEEVTDEETRADSAIIVSVNIDTGEITMTSILRDSYCYYEVEAGEKESGKYGKINEAMMYGGIDCYIRAVENNFKINIDNYVIVNFDSFQKIIDSVGGVDVEMTKAEINEINNHQKRYGHVTIDAEPGVVHLNGEQALAFCRIRKIDSDEVRADRQKTVLLQIFDKMKNASTVKILEAANSLLPYVKTGYSKSEVISIASYALKNGWLGYTTQTCTVPANETDENGEVITTCKGGKFYGVWCWKVDFPLSAQLLQKRIYGKTNITLAEKRPNFLNLQ